MDERSSQPHAFPLLKILCLSVMFPSGDTGGTSLGMQIPHGHLHPKGCLVIVPVGVCMVPGALGW